MEPKAYVVLERDNKVGEHSDNVQPTAAYGPYWNLAQAEHKVGVLESDDPKATKLYRIVPLWS